MKTTTKLQHEESTYAMLVRSRGEERALFETAVYALLILCAAFSFWQSVQQPFQLPRIGLLQEGPIAEVANVSPPRA